MTFGYCPRYLVFSARREEILDHNCPLEYPIESRGAHFEHNRMVNDLFSLTLLLAVVADAGGSEFKKYFRTYGNYYVRQVHVMSPSSGLPVPFSLRRPCVSLRSSANEQVRTDVGQIGERFRRDETDCQNQPKSDT